MFSEAGIRDSSRLCCRSRMRPRGSPARGSYEYAAAASGADPASMLLVAVHPWDIHGAASAGCGRPGLTGLGKLPGLLCGFPISSSQH